MLGAWLGRLVEELPQVGLALAVELVDDLRPVDREEVGLGFVGHGPGEQRLAAAGRAVQAARPWGRRSPAARTAPGTSAAARRSRARGPAAASGRRCPRRRAAWRPRPAWPSPACDLQAACRTTTTTGPAGRVLFTRKSARRLPNSVARTRSPAIDRQAVQQAADVLQVAAGGGAALGDQHQLFAPAGPTIAADHGRFVESDAGVLADDAVDLQMLLAAVLLEGRQHAADGPPLALDFDACRRRRRRAAACRPGRSVRCPRPTSLPVDSLTRRVISAASGGDFTMMAGRFQS